MPGSGRRAGPRRRSPHGQAASRSARVLWDEALHRQITEPFGQPFGHTEVQLADGARIAGRDLGERAAAEHEVDPTTTFYPGRTKAATVISASSRSTLSLVPAISAARRCPSWRPT